MKFGRNFIYVNYIDEYLRYSLDNFSQRTPHYFCTYYKFDYESSIVDDRDDINGGTYRTLGEFSGRKWKQILFFPIWLMDEHGSITQEDTERSIEKRIELSYAFSDNMGVRPTSKDFVWFYDNVQMKDSSETKPVFIVQNFEVSHIGKKTWYKINLKNSRYQHNDIKQHISTQWAYLYNIGKIYNINTANLLMSSCDLLYNFFTDINHNNNSEIGYNTKNSMYFFK